PVGPRPAPFGLPPTAQPRWPAPGGVGPSAHSLRSPRADEGRGPSTFRRAGAHLRGDRDIVVLSPRGPMCRRSPTAITQPPPGPPPSPLAPSPGIPPSSGAGGPGGPNLVNGATTHGLMGRKGIRHPWEMPLLWVGIVLTVIAYFAWWVLIISSLVLQVTEGEATVQSLWQYVGILPFFIQLVVVLPLAPLLVWWARAMMYARLRVSAVRMSPTQFPEGYRMVVEAAEQFGMRKVPDAYVVMGNGVGNAFAAGHGFRRFV